MNNPTEPPNNNIPHTNPITPRLSSFSWSEFLRSSRGANFTSLALTALFFTGLYIATRSDEENQRKIEELKLIQKERERRMEIKYKILDEKKFQPNNGGNEK